MNRTRILRDRGVSVAMSLAIAPVSMTVARAEPPPPPFQSVDADGWQAQKSEPSDLSMQPVQVQRQGFDASGNATSISDVLYLTKRVRQPYPANAQFTADQVALSDYVYADDSIAGAANNSAMVSPKPRAAWTMPGHSLVGNSADWSLAAFHRDAREGRQVAAVRVRFTDGTNATAWQTVSSTSLLTTLDYGAPIEVFAGTIDISALADGLIWIEAEVFPWFGSNASVLRSEDVVDARGFSRRYFRKDPARFAAPPLAYVSGTGDDATGVVSTDASVAKASPFLTIEGAMAGAHVSLGSADGALDGLRIRPMNAVEQGATGTYAFRKQAIAAVIVEPDPDVNPASATVIWNARYNPQLRSPDTTVGQAAWRYRGVHLTMGGNYQLDGHNASTPTIVQFENVTCDFAGFSFLRSSSHVEVFGMAGFNHPTGAFVPFIKTTNGLVRALIGLECDVKAKSNEAWVTIGCKLEGVNAPGYSDPSKGAIFANNELRRVAAVTGPMVFKGTESGGDLSGLVVVQNLIEVTHTSPQASTRLSADSDFGSVTDAVIHHNTTTGTGQLGRWNVFYDEHPTVPRQHRLISCKGNIIQQLNTKGDVFAGNNTSISDPGSRLGQFAFQHGVGCAGNWTIAAANAPSSEHPDYFGEGSVLAGGDPLFVDYRGTTGSAFAAVAGAGGGDYSLQSGSGARDILATPLLAFDLAGVARGSGAQAAGAYV